MNYFRNNKETKSKRVVNFIIYSILWYNLNENGLNFFMYLALVSRVRLG